MARATQDVPGDHAGNTDAITLDGTSGTTLNLPGNEFVTDADMLRDGQDLILRAPDGSEVIVENYFSAEPSPVLVSAGGAALTPDLVDSFVKPVDGAQFAQNGSMDDESPVGMVKETSGDATITHPDGTIAKAAIGTPIYQGDIVETKGDGAVNITFVDDTTFAVSENARLSIDEYVFDPATQSGENNFSVLRGVFVFTSGLIGREDPDDVQIDTPVGSIGIRGTTIMGTINPNGDSQITVVEGAIVVRNSSGEQTLSQQFETVRLAGFDGQMTNEGQLSSQQIAESYNVLRSVSAPLFSNIDDSSAEGDQPADDSAPADEGPTEDGEAAAPADAAPATQDGTESTDPAKTDDGAQLAPTDQQIITETADAGFDTGASVNTQPASSPAPVMILSNTFAPPPSGPAPMGPAPANSFKDAGHATTLPPPNVINGGGTGGTVAPPLPAWDVNLNDVISGAMTTKASFIAAPGGTTDWLHGANVLGIGSNNFFAFTTAYDLYLHTPTPTPYALSTYGISSTTDHSISFAGDMNGDGVGDYILGSNQDNIVVLIDGAAPTNFVNITGFIGGSNAGDSVSGIGDFNGDGYGDVAFSAPNLVGGPSKLHIVYGDDGLLSLGSFSLSTWLATGIGGIDDPDGFTLTESGTTVNMGRSVAGLQDFNNDGYSDFAVTKTGLNSVSIFMGDSGNQIEFTGITNASASDLSTILSLGDLNGGKSSDLGIYESGTNTLHIMYGEGTYAASQDIDTPAHGLITSADEMIGGGFAGDFNGDGIDDIALATRAGDKVDIFVVYGKAGMINYDLSNLTDAQGFSMSLNLASPQFNLANPATDEIDLSLSTMGDRNGDGFDDLLIGIQNLDNDGDPNLHTDSGGVAVIDGRAEAADLASGKVKIGATVATMDGQTLIGTPAGNTLYDYDGVTLFNNLMFKGGAGDDLFNMSNTMQRGIDGGAGFDTLNLLSGANTDLRIMGSNLQGIEQINFQSANQIVKINIEDIFRLLQESDTDTLKFNSAFGGTQLHIDTNGTDNDGNAVPDSDMFGLGFTGGSLVGGYNEWHYGSYTLLIDMDVSSGTPAVSNIA